jgi:formylglycine-generating enzyme required for sulfatase activity
MPGYNIMIQGEFTRLDGDVFSVQVGAFSHGRITANPGYGKKGTNIFLTITPDAGYQLSPGSLYYVDSSGTEIHIPNDSFSLPDSHVKIKARFERLSENVFTISGRTPNGRIISRPESGKESDLISLWVMPDKGYYYVRNTLKYKLIPSNAEYELKNDSRTFKLNASNVEVWAEFRKITDNNNFTIQVSPTSHGMIYPQEDYGNEGRRISLKILPDPGYELEPKSLYYTYGSNSIQYFNGTETGFNMPKDHVTVYGKFKAVTYTVNVDPAIAKGAITVTPGQGTIGTPVKLDIVPQNGYRLKPNSLKYRGQTTNKETSINEKTRQFPMPPENSIIMARFEPYSALGNLKVNDRPVKGLASGKTDYTVWIPQQEKEAKITFTTETGISVSPASGETVELDVLEKKPVVFTVSSDEGKVKTEYTITVIREFIPTEAVPAGSFQRDSNIYSISNLPTAFRMGKREVTQEEWSRVMGFERGGKATDLPAHRVSWYEAVEFCNKLSMLEGKTPVYVVNSNTDPAKWGERPTIANNRSWYVSCKWEADGYRLPTEMEWQWAAMGADAPLKKSTNTEGFEYAFAGAGNKQNKSPADTAWYKDNAGGAIHAVGTKAPNKLELYDMSGKVMEWCWDWTPDNYQKNYGLGGGTYTNYRGGDNNTGFKMRRGGSYLSEASGLFLNYRGNESGSQTKPFVTGDPRINDEYVGLRILYRD